MNILTEDAVILCDHKLGKATMVPTQLLVTVEGRQLLVARDPEFKPISGCPNVGATIKPCTMTLLAQVGYSSFVRVNGRAVCLDTISGLTDGTPPGNVNYNVQEPGQNFVTATE